MESNIYFRQALYYVAGRNAEVNINSYYVEPFSFAKNYFFQCLIEVIELKNFYNEYLSGCELFDSIVSV